MSRFHNFTDPFVRGPRRGALSLLAGAVFAVAVPLAHATSYTLTDLNSSITVDPTSQDGISAWKVDGVNQLYQQWFWGREGSTGPEHSLDSLTLLNAKATDTNFNPGNDTLSLLYGDGTTTADSSLTVALHLSLAGGAAGSRTSDLNTQAMFSNLTDSPVTLHIFQYSDFDLSDNSDNDTATAPNANTIIQSDGGMILTDSAAPTPSKWQIGPYSGLLDSLNDSGPTGLTDSGSGTVGDATYARQWDFTLPPKGSGGATVGFSLDQHLSVPDPGTVLLLAAGMLGLAAANRRRAAPAEQD